MKDGKPDLQVMIIGEGGEAIVQVFGHEAVLTVRQPDSERLAEVRLTSEQAGAPRPCSMGQVLQALEEHPEHPVLCRLPADTPTSELRESWAPMDMPRHFHLFGKPGRGWRR